ncbi:MAG: PP2C family protein-serine/threonine phosphatase [Vulcanimicrobiota bacterium]
MTLRKKMLISVGGLTVLLLISLQAVSLYGVRQISRTSLQETSLLLARYQADKVDASLEFAETSSEAILRAVEHSDLLDDTPRMVAYLTEILQGSRQISAIEVHPPNTSPIVLRRTADGQFVYAEPVYGSEQAQMLTLREKVDGVWNVSGRSREIARAYHLQSRRGVNLFIEIPFHLLSEPLGISEGTAYGFLATETRLFFDARLTGIEEAEEWGSFSDQVVLGPMDGEGFRVLSDPLYHAPAWVGVARVGDLPLKAGVVYPEADQFSLVSDVVSWTVTLSVVGVILILVVTNILSKGIVAPLEHLCERVDAVAESDFEGQIAPSPSASSEIVGLAQSFNRLLADVRRHLGELESATATRQAMESELTIASRIQESILPDFPFASELVEAEGVSRPARQVGGDFLDVFAIDPDRVGFFLGDVSGKGVPAAIYMAFTASLLEHLGRLRTSPSQVIEMVNKALCDRQEQSMFATVFFGILHRSGEVTYCNAGHHPPLLLSPDGSVREIKVEAGLGLGILDSFEFGESRFSLSEGETLFLFTDGLTEAMNCNREEYGEDRLASFLASEKVSGLKDLMERLTLSVEQFRDGAEPNDDLTLLFLRHRQAF